MNSDSPAAAYSPPGSTTLLIGPSGTGKTTSIRTFVDAGITPFCIFTEKKFGILASIPPEKLHWTYLPQADTSWKVLEEMAQKVNTLPYDALLKYNDNDRGKHNELLRVYQTLSNFKCERTGESFGAVDSWGPDRVLVIDSLTGLNNMAMGLIIGGKPVRDQKDWGMAQNILEQLLLKLTSGLRCHILLIGHVEREYIEANSSVLLTISTLGKALAPKIPRLFDDVILSKREVKEFYWSNADVGVDTKPGYLPIVTKMPPTFVPLIEAWRKTQGAPG